MGPVDGVDAGDSQRIVNTGRPQQVFPQRIVMAQDANRIRSRGDRRIHEQCVAAVRGRVVVGGDQDSLGIVQLDDRVQFIDRRARCVARRGGRDGNQVPGVCLYRVGVAVPLT